MELAHFYTWTVEDMKKMSMYELDKAREYMQHVNKQENGDTNKRRGNRRK